MAAHVAANDTANGLRNYTTPGDAYLLVTLLLIQPCDHAIADDLSDQICHVPGLLGLRYEPAELDPAERAWLIQARVRASRARCCASWPING